LNSNGEWQTTYQDSGTYTTTVAASDGRGGITNQEVSITVLESGNHPPLIEPIDDIAVIEGQTVIIHPVVSDPDGDELTVTISEPVGNDGIWQTKRGDAGTYIVTITASDGTAVTQMSVRVTVNEKPYQHIRLDRVRLSKTRVKPGEEVMVTVTVESDGNMPASKSKVTVSMPELGIRVGTPRFKISNNQVTKRLLIRVPYYAQPGLYPVRVVVSNDYTRRVVFRELEVI
ncbi:hypothetical protein DRJ48_04485, partial [Candidatus Woesearchaeota archaeon]